MTSIKKHGGVLEHRRRIYARPLPSSRYALLMGGHIVEAVRRCMLRCPENPQVKWTLSLGLKGVLIMHEETPPEVRDWIAQFANWFGGVSYTLREYLLEFCKKRVQLLAWCTKNNIDKNTCGKGDTSSSVYPRPSKLDHRVHLSRTV